MIKLQNENENKESNIFVLNIFDSLSFNSNKLKKQVEYIKNIINITKQSYFIVI
jgi:hypothetical protein